jgi:hypothetical protein
VAKVEERVYSADSDDYKIVKKETYTSLEKEKKKAKFKSDPIKDFITEGNRKKYGHICYRCKDKKFCKRWIGKIIMNCDDLRR